MTEFEQVRDALVSDLHELKQALYPAAEKETDDMIAVLTGDTSKGFRTAQGQRLSAQDWLNLSEDQQLTEMGLLRKRVREKIDSVNALQAQAAKTTRLAKQIAAVGFALIVIAVVAWMLL